MYEHRHQRLLARHHFARRLFRHGVFAVLLLVFSLGLGTFGFCEVGLCGPHGIDALLNSAMLLGGMGPVGNFPNTTAAKLFASGFALYAGLAFLVAAALLLTPVFHRILHHFHCGAEESA
jgi:hypothetical protein